MRSIAFLTHKGGVGKTTLTAALAVAAAAAGEKVIALDLDLQGSLVRWSERRKAANAPNTVVIEPLETERLPQLPAILDGFAGVGFTLAVFDTADADAGAVRLIIDSVDLCLLPARPTRLDVDAAAATFRATFLANRKAAFVLNQCPATRRSPRVGEAAKELLRALAFSRSRSWRRATIFRMPSPLASASRSTHAPARRRRKSRPCGTGLVPAADARITLRTTRPDAGPACLPPSGGQGWRLRLRCREHG
jgi:chromosome partitioning protein